jgi:hypothetical protein
MDATNLFKLLSNFLIRRLLSFFWVFTDQMFMLGTNFILFIFVCTVIFFKGY